MTGKEIGGPILSDHQEESSRVIQEAHWQQQVTDSARRTLDTLHDIFIFSLFVFCPVIRSLVCRDAQSRVRGALDGCLFALVFRLL